MSSSSFFYPCAIIIEFVLGWLWFLPGLFPLMSVWFISCMLQWMSFPFLYGVRCFCIVWGVDWTESDQWDSAENVQWKFGSFFLFLYFLCKSLWHWCLVVSPLKNEGRGVRMTIWWIGDECSDLQLSWLCVCSYWPDWQFPWLCDLQFLWLDEFVWLYNGIQFERCGQETQI